ILTGQVINEILRGVEVLCRLGQAGESDTLRSFREAFSARFELAKVPLLDALDEETGVGFGPAGADNLPLLRGIQLVGAAAEGGNPTNTQSLLLQKIVDRIGPCDTELSLSVSDLPSGDANEQLLPDSFSVGAVIAAASADAIQQGDFRVYLRGGAGP